MLEPGIMPLTLKPRAILIDVIPPSLPKTDAERRLNELDLLTRTYGGIVVVKLLQKRSPPDYRTYVGPGKLDEIIQLAKEEKAELLVVNNALKPGQMFNVGEKLRPHKMRVWDRIDLILNIFAKHAQTSEAKLQIRLAAIKHMGPRIFGMGQEMMQQAGGTATRGGQGETNTELMKRHLFEQEKRIRAELDRIAVSRAGHRKRRDRMGLKTVSVVGYTNAGKSSLLRAMTGKHTLVADALFATLDTRVGKLWIPGKTEAEQGHEVLLSDTIGFIQDLPPQLIEAFRSTLDETIEADLLLHVIDASDPFMHDKIREVEDVLSSLGVAQTPKLYVFNKIDLLKRVPRSQLKKTYKVFAPTFASAMSGEGLEELKRQIAESLGLLSE